MVRGRKFRTDEAGAVAPLVGLSLFALIAAAGIAFDYSRIASLDTEMQNAADQAALAAASQLDKEAGATTRGTAAAQGLLANLTFLGNDGGGTDVAIVEAIYYKSKQQAVLDNPTDPQTCPVTDIGGGEDADAVAGYVCVRTATRAANFTLTPIVAAFSGNASAMAVATIERATCKSPPLMICNPKPNPTPTDKLTDTVPVGAGVRVTGHGNTKDCQGAGTGSKKFNVDSDGDGVNDEYWVDTDGDGTYDLNCQGNIGAWAPGDFGFLEVGDGSNAQLKRALAQQILDFDCVTDTNQKPNTGNPQGLYAAINTRFGIYDFAENGNHDLSGCNNPNNKCPSATNARIDLVNASAGSKCGLSPGASGQGYDLPATQYKPKLHSAITSGGLTHDGSTPTAIGYPRDLCHYTSFGKSCTNTSYPARLGDGEWGRADYFAKYHPGVTGYPSNITRYQTYRWEQGASIAGMTGSGTGGATPVCNRGTVLPGIDRRVLTVAIVNNCSALTGGSTNVVIGEFVDMFLVQPVFDNGQGRGNGDIKDSIYMELIGPSPSGANGFQTVVKEVPLIIK